MKKALLILSLVVFIVLSLCSCDLINSRFEPKTAAELWERIDAEMNSLNSYRTDISATMSFEINDIEIEGEIIGYSIYDGINDDDPYFYESADTTVRSTAAKIEETSKSMVAYKNGRMFISDTSGNETIKLCSDLSKEDFVSYISSSDIEISPERCSDVMFLKNEDSTWILEFSGFYSTDINRILDALEFSDADFGVSVTDIAIAVKADEKYRVNELKLELICEDYDKPFLSMTTVYSKYNEVNDREFDGAGYELVDDVRIPRWINSALSQAKRSRSGDFTLDVEYALKGKTGTVISEYNEYDIVSYKVLAGEFRYTVIATTDEQKVEIEYKNGQQEIFTSASTLPQYVDQTEEEARAFIFGLLNSAGYDRMLIDDIEEISDNVYKISCNVNDTSGYDAIMRSFGDLYRSHTYFITVTVNGDQVETIESDLTINGIQYDYTVKSCVNLK